MLFVEKLIMGPTQISGKTAILVLYLQLFAVQKYLRYAIYAGIVFIFLVYFPHFILICVDEAPRVGQSWSLLATDGMPQYVIFNGPIHGFGSIILDVYIFILPLPMSRGGGRFS
ncbi:hypothetical protein GGR56DRAFT_612710 [Xylariaceae sp. FL0804]|nr:hypothetical protein GGR56DRAFT_612710 [Xylariaceae sp. FL0804]